VTDGLGRLESAGKTGTSNDSRDSWYAGYTGDHLAVIWVGNDQNQPTGLYGATGGMRVWSGLFSRLPSKPLDIGGKGLDFQWVSGGNVTDAQCPGARRFAFVAGFQPAYAPCTVEPQAEAEQGSNWRDWFGFGKDNNDQQAPQPQAQPQQQPAQPAPEPQR
jgi:penicillin-binding protein 1B